MPLALSLLIMATAWTSAHGVRDRVFRGVKESPLPIFTSVTARLSSRTNRTTITVHYDASEPPKPSGIWTEFHLLHKLSPSLGRHSISAELHETGKTLCHLGSKSAGTLSCNPAQLYKPSSCSGRNPNVHTNNFYETVIAFAIIVAPASQARQFTLCLQTSLAKTCLELRPLLHEGTFEESVDFPWPLLVPAPMVRYDAGQRARLFAPALTTPHNYSYSAYFLFTQSSHSDPQATLRYFLARGMEGGDLRDTVTIQPVTSGSPGWMVELATEMYDFEGVLLFKTNFKPQLLSGSELVEGCTTTRPLNVYLRHHPAPFPPGFAALVAYNTPSLPHTCLAGSRCLVSCPFVASGDVTVSIARLRHGAMAELVAESLAGEVWRLGDFYGEARFVLNDFDRSLTGTYGCSVTTAQRTVAGNLAVSEFRQTHYYE